MRRYAEQVEAQLVLFGTLEFDQQLGGLRRALNDQLEARIVRIRRRVVGASAGAGPFPATVRYLPPIRQRPTCQYRFGSKRLVGAK